MMRSDRSRRDLLRRLCGAAGGLALAAANCREGHAADVGTGPARSSSAAVHNVLDFGAAGDGRADDRAALSQAFDHARAQGGDVYIPAGIFAHSGLLSANGIRISGAGEGSVLRATHYGREALILRGDGVSLRDLRLEGYNGARLSTDESARIVVQSATRFSIEKIHIRGSSSAGIKVNDSSYGRIARNVIESTRADSIHMVQGTHDILIEHNRIMRSGDDGISVVSYRNDGLVRNIVIRNNEVLRNTWGRGIAVGGGVNVAIVRNRIEGGAADRAGIYIAAEGEWNTEGVRNVRVDGNRVVDAGGRLTNHGAITVYNSQGDAGLALACISIVDNDIIAPRRMGILVAGPGVIVLAAYGNRIVGSKHGDIVNIGERATVATSPSSLPGACEME